jgi:polysaccharide export outer membrane protein
MGSRAKAALLAIGLIMAAAAASAEDYRLNPGDVLRVSVWREEGLERELLVQPDGTISFPLAGQVAATNHTVGELEAEIAQRLERYIPGPVVTPFAGRGRIRVVRKADGAETVVPFHYGDVADGDAADVELRAGDVVIVPGGSLF